MGEEAIRFLLLKQLLKESKHINLASIEVPLIQGKRKIDLMIVKNNELIAYEIKSYKDNLSKLNGQVLDYLKIFDRIYLVLDKKFEKNIGNFHSNVGIILFDIKDLKFKTIKKAKKNKPVLYHQSMFIDNITLQAYEKRNKISSIFELRHSLVKKIDKKAFKKIMLECLNKKYAYGFKLFQSISKLEKDRLHLSDMYLLSSGSHIKELVDE